MKKKNYDSPTVEIVEIEIEGCILLGSVEDIQNGGSAW